MKVIFVVASCAFFGLQEREEADVRPPLHGAFARLGVPFHMVQGKEKGAREQAKKAEIAAEIHRLKTKLAQLAAICTQYDCQADTSATSCSVASKYERLPAPRDGSRIASALILVLLALLVAVRVWPRQIGLPQAAAVQPWSLTFTDAELEAQYTDAAFRAACTPFVAFIGVIAVLDLMLAVVYPNIVESLLTSIVAKAVSIAARLWADRMADQQHARVLFGRMIIAFTLLFWGVLVSIFRPHHLHPPEPSVMPGALVAAAVMVCLTVIYLHLSAVTHAHRLAYIAITALGSTALPTSTELSQSAESLCVCGALLLGEVVGYTVEFESRRTRLGLHARDLQQLEDKKEAQKYRRATEELKQLGAAKDNFVASLSHEMRTPLNGVFGMLQIAQRCADWAELRELLDKAETACQMLVGLLDETLDITKFEKGLVQLSSDHLSLPKLSRDCVALVCPTASTKDITLQLQIDETVEAAGDCVGDKRRLQQLFFNLLTNAIKFTPNGGRVDLCLAKRPRPASSTLPEPSSEVMLPLLLTVKDTGVGVHKEDLDMIFLPYTKAAKNTRNASGIDRQAGAGLGLSICQSIARLHCGEIWAESTHGEGSTFSVKLDLPLVRQEAPPEADDSTEGGGGHCVSTPTTRRRLTHETPIGTASEAEEAHAPSLDGLRVLVADDSEMNRTVATMMLQKLGCITTVVEDGLAAATAVRTQREAGAPFAAVFMDVQMPVMDGLEAVAAVRKLEGAAARTFVAACTGFGGADERARCLAAGMDDFVTKPISLPAVESMLSAARVQR